MTSLAFLMKPSFALASAAFMALYLRRSLIAKNSRLKMVWEQLVLLATALSGFAVILLVFQHWGVLRDFWEACFIFNYRIYTAKGAESFFDFINWGVLLYSLVNRDQIIVLGCLLYLILIFAARWEKDKFESRLTLLVLFLVSLASIIIQGKRIPYHKIPAFGFASMFAGAFFAQLSSLISVPLSNITKRLLNWSIIISILFLEIVNFETKTFHFILNDSFRGLDSAYLAQPGGYSHKVAQYINQNTSPDDYIYGWGQSGLYFLARRRSPTRHIWRTMLVLRRPDGTMHPLQERWETEIINDLHAHTPVYFVVSIQKESELSAGFPALRNYIKNNYVIETVIDEFTIYKLKN